MKRLIIALLSLFIIILSGFLLIKPKKRTAASNALLPFEDYPVGSYFTKDGKNCNCHKTCNCIESGNDCNCMRFYPTGNAETCEIDLLGVQCVGFARMCEYRLFGYIDYGKTADKFKNLLPFVLEGGSWTKEDAEKYISIAVIGGHIRIGTHSLIIMNIYDWGFDTYECNSSVKGRECMVFTRSWTWKSFYSSYKDSDWKYLNVPKDVKYLDLPNETSSTAPTSLPTAAEIQALIPIETQADTAAETSVATQADTAAATQVEIPADTSADTQAETAPPTAIFETANPVIIIAPETHETIAPETTVESYAYESNENPPTETDLPETVSIIPKAERRYSLSSVFQSVVKSLAVCIFFLYAKVLKKY